MSRKFALAAVVGALLATGGYLALAQTTTLPQVATLNPTDLFNDVVTGVPNAQNKYATAGQIASAPGYKALYAGADAAGQTLTYTQLTGISNIIAYSSGSAITSVTITTDANPGDGEKVCYLGSGAATSTLAFTANTGQTIGTGYPSAGVSNVSICLVYVGSLAKWMRSN